MTSLKLYTPQDIEALTQRRGFHKQARKALDLAYDLMCSRNGVRQVSCKVLYAALGRPNHDFGRFFHSLFTCTSSYIVGERNSSYTISEENIQRLQNLVRCNHISDFQEWCHERGRTFLEQPPMREQLSMVNERVYPWWATMRASWRRNLFLLEHGELWDYDIANAKPTLILQVYDRMKGPREGKVPTWRRYVEDRSAVRAELMQDMGWDKDKVKSALHAVCNGTWVGRRNGCLEDEKEFSQHPIYIGLREDLQRIWSVLQQLKRKGETQGECLSREYVKLENAIISEIAQELDPNFWVWWIHDGWMMKDRLADVEHLQDHIRQKLKLNITIEETHYKEDNRA